MQNRVYVVDQEARDMAAAAKALIQSHEQVCAERWRNAARSLGRIEHILTWGIGGLIATMLSLIGWLAVHPLH